MAAGDGKAANLRVHLRGSHLTLGREVPRGFPHVLAGEGQARIGKESGRLRCEGTVVHRGSRVAAGEARLVDEKGKLYATASSSCLILSA